MWYEGIMNEPEIDAEKEVQEKDVKTKRFSWLALNNVFSPKKGKKKKERKDINKKRKDNDNNGEK